MYTSSINGTLIQFIDDIYTNNLSSIMAYFNNYFLKSFNPDITGFSLVIFVPPLFSKLSGSNIFNVVLDVRKLFTFAAIDFTPPTIQITGSTVNPHLGGFPFAVEVAPSAQCSVTYIDNNQLSIYNFHAGWTEYVKALIEGIIDAPDFEKGLDYVGTFYIVKYDQSMKTIKFIGKCTGVFPQSLPNKEMIGQRTQHDLATLPITYYSTFYEEAFDDHHPIFEDLMIDISHFSSTLDENIYSAPTQEDQEKSGWERVASTGRYSSA